jgi:hypothetical protein
MTSLHQSVGSLESGKPRSRISLWLTATGYLLCRWLATIAYIFSVFRLGLGSSVSGDIKPFAVLAVTVAYAILMLLLWLHERFPPRF